MSDSVRTEPKTKRIAYHIALPANMFNMIDDKTGAEELLKHFQMIRDEVGAALKKIDPAMTKAPELTMQYHVDYVPKGETDGA